MSDLLTIWTITHRPSDLPDVEYALRPHYIRRGATEAGSIVFTGDTLDEVRAFLPAGLHNLGRQDGDDPVIVESWI